jgi:hypothetical protein
MTIVSQINAINLKFKISTIADKLLRQKQIHLYVYQYRCYNIIIDIVTPCNYSGIIDIVTPCNYSGIIDIVTPCNYSGIIDIVINDQFKTLPVKSYYM